MEPNPCKFLLFVYNCITVGDLIIKRGRVGIPVIGLTPPNINKANNPKYIFLMKQVPVEQPPQLMEHKKKVPHISMEIHVVAWDRFDIKFVK
jgi:hypothetical protein